jgi:hypothetical protein
LPKGIPVYIPHRISTIEAKPYPLYVPIGKSDSAIFGLEVSFPYLSAAYLFGRFLFLFLGIHFCLIKIKLKIYQTRMLLINTERKLLTQILQNHSYQSEHTRGMV